MIMKNLYTLGALGLLATSANAQVVFDNIPATLAGNYPSLGYQATQTAEFGNKITLAGSTRLATAATLTMSSWAKKSDWPTVGTATTFDHDITLNIYAAGTGNTVGALIGTKTQTFSILYRPESFGFNGIAQNITFDLSSLNLNYPDTFIYGLAYNTQTWGANPTGVGGPYNSLNYAVIDSAPTVGTDNDADDTFWNTQTAGNYTDGGVGGVGTFRRDTGWTGFTPMARFDSVPEPASMTALALGGLALLKRRKKA